MMLKFQNVVAPFLDSVDGLDLYNEAIDSTQGDVCITDIEQKGYSLVFESRPSYFERLYKRIPSELEDTINAALSQLNGGEINVRFSHVSRSLMGQTFLNVNVAICGAAYVSLLSFYHDNKDALAPIIKEEYQNSALADDYFYLQLREGSWRPIKLLLTELIKTELDSDSIYEFLLYIDGMQHLKYTIVDSGGEDTLLSISDFE